MMVWSHGHNNWNRVPVKGFLSGFIEFRVIYWV